MRGALTLWKKTSFGNIHIRKAMLPARRESKLKWERACQITLLSRRGRSRKALSTHLPRKKPFGDRKTSFFHASAVVRRNKNRVCMLKNSEGEWVGEQSELELMALNFFKEHPFPIGSEDRALQSLMVPVSEFEIQATLKQMGSYKAPGPDGVPKGVNDTLIALIAKVHVLKCITQFPSISLCNIQYKIITKILASSNLWVILSNRLKAVLFRVRASSIISSSSKKPLYENEDECKKWMILKIDLEKAFDRLSWDFVIKTLTYANLPRCWVD
ncbi:LOW QUALITY PROTEIN: hypothetical protein V2J09_006718 [Rumex salicifolius]